MSRRRKPPHRRHKPKPAPYPFEGTPVALHEAPRGLIIIDDPPLSANQQRAGELLHAWWEAVTRHPPPELYVGHHTSWVQDDLFSRLIAEEAHEWP